MANGNNIAEFILKITAQGTEDARQFAVELNNIDQAAGKVASSANTASGNAAGFAGALGKGGDAAKGATGSFLGLAGGIGLVQQALGIGFSIAGIVALATSAAQTVRSFEQIADMMDTDIGKASQMAFAVEKTGRSYEVLRQAAMFASVAVQQMPTNATKRSAALTLGINPDEAMTAYELIKKVGNAYNSTIEIEGHAVSQAEKMRAARELLGRSTIQLLPAFQQYWSELETGRKLTDEERESSEKFLRTVHELQETVKFGIGIPVIEFINSHKGIITVIGGVIGITEAFRILKSLQVVTWISGIISSLGSLDVALITGAGTAAECTAALGGLATVSVASGYQLFRAYNAFTDWRTAADQAAESQARLNTQMQTMDALLDKWVPKLKTLTLDQLLKMPAEQSAVALNQLRIVLKNLQNEYDSLAVNDPRKEKMAADLRQLRELQNNFQIIRPTESAPRRSDVASVTVSDPKDVKRKTDEDLKVIKDFNAAAQAERELAVKRGQLSEQDALTKRWQDVVGEYEMELQGFDQLQAAIAAARKKNTGSNGVVIDKEHEKQLAAQENALNAARTEAESAFQKAAADSSLKFTDQQLKNQKVVADAEIALAKARGDEVLAIRLEQNQKIAELTRASGGTLSPELKASLESTRDIAIAMAQFNAADASITAQIAVHQKEIDRLNAESTADPSKRAFNAQAIREQEAAIVSLVQHGLPMLQKYYDALAAGGVDLHRLDELQAKIQSLDVTATKMQKDLGKGGMWGETSAGIKNLTAQWTDLSHNISTVAVGAIQSFAQASTNALMGLITGTKSAGQAFAEFALGVIQSVIQMVIQQLLAMAIIRAMGVSFAAASVAAGIATGGALLAAYAPAAMAASIMTMGAADIAGATGFSTAMGMAMLGLAEGGLITGGTPGKDSVPAMLMPGEFVLPARAVNDIGVDRLEGIRKGLTNRTIGVPAFSAPSQPYAEAGQRGGQSNVTVKTGAPDTHVLIGDREIEKVFASPSATKFFKTSIAVHGAAINDSLTKHRGYK